MIFKNLSKNFIISFSLVLTIFLLDRLSKMYVIYLNKKFYASEFFSSKFLNIQLIWNEGIAFGLFSFDKNYLYNILTLTILLIIIIITLMLLKSSGLKMYSLIMVLGGALGNLCDRIIYQAVPDFIDLHINDFHWFIFNVADIFITIGVISMVIIELTNNEKKFKK